MSIFLIFHKKLKNSCSTLDLNSKPFNEENSLFPLYHFRIITMFVSIIICHKFIFTKKLLNLCYFIFKCYDLLFHKLILFLFCDNAINSVIYKICHYLYISCDYILSCHYLYISCDYILSCHYLYISCDYILSCHYLTINCYYILSCHHLHITCDYILSCHYLYITCDYF